MRYRWFMQPVPQRTTQIVAMRSEDHMTYREIGERFGISGTRVRQIVEEHGWRLRQRAAYESTAIPNWVGEAVPS